MLIRTYIRTLFNDIFKNNFFIRTINKIVNFYCNFFFSGAKTLKFEQNLPKNNMEAKKVLFFQSVTGDKIDCK